jgi:peptide/nickel transport system permease protein
MNVAAVLALNAMLLLAVFADCLASDKPLYARLRGQSYVLPNLFEHPDLRPYSNQSLLAQLTPEDTVVLPPIPWGTNSHDLTQVLAPPSSAHPLGTDPSGRDVLARLIHGARVSLAVGLGAVVVLLGIGVLLGGLGGYLGGPLDAVASRLAEVVMSIPGFLLVAALFGPINPQGLEAVVTMMVTLGVVSWPSVARLTRAEVLRVRSMSYVEAARALGMGHARIILRHVLPNALGPVWVAGTFGMASTLLTEGVLSFLGFGIPADMASWGGMLHDVRGNAQAWWLAVYPGLAIFVTVTACNLVGEGLRDAIAPRLK